MNMSTNDYHKSIGIFLCIDTGIEYWTFYFKYVYYFLLIESAYNFFLYDLKL